MEAADIRLLERASEEIKSLRRHIDILAPKAEAYDNMAAVISLLPQRSQGMGADVAWKLDLRIQELITAPEAPTENSDS